MSSETFFKKAKHFNNIFLGLWEGRALLGCSSKKATNFLILAVYLLQPLQLQKIICQLLHILLTCPGYTKTEADTVKHTQCSALRLKKDEVLPFFRNADLACQFREKNQDGVFAVLGYEGVCYNLFLGNNKSAGYTCTFAGKSYNRYVQEDVGKQPVCNVSFSCCFSLATWEETW